MPRKPRLPGPSLPSNDDLYLAIDQGGHASRAMVFDIHGQILAEARHEISTLFPHKDWVEHDAEALVKSVSSSIYSVLGQLGHRKNQVIAAGLATQRSNITCWDKETGKALCPIISYQDRRQQTWIKQFTEHKVSIHNITGLFLSAHYGAGKLRWCWDHLEEVRKAFEESRLAWGPMASYLSFRLLDGNPILTDPSNASRTLLWSLKDWDWSNDLLSLFDLPIGPLPQCVPTRHAFGMLNMDDVKIPMKIITGDQSAALFAFGDPKPNTAYITVGTGAFVHQLSTEKHSRAPSLLTSIHYQDKELTLFSQEGTINGAGSALDWITRELGMTDTLKNLPRWLETCSTPPLFMNGVSGLGTPCLKADFVSCFVGPGEDWEKVVAVVESIVFLIQLNFEELRSSFSAPEQILIGGGLARLDGLCQRLADLSGITVIRHEVRETTARGLAYLLTDFASTFSESNRFCYFKPQDRAGLRSRYLLWRESLLCRVKS